MAEKKPQDSAEEEKDLQDRTETEEVPKVWWSPPEMLLQRATAQESCGWCETGSGLKKTWGKRKRNHYYASQDQAAATLAPYLLGLVFIYTIDLCIHNDL
ncbi:hypothetical protein NDU88_008725 [Pleurodeles waltl]|uniref:Uncharacterized protein n=1 Tax=Pleurodeles waltl TaxID=8319 RepID=A0AAV7N7A9_PLEWA|nr:hypothetical protein NDU88_008725 [Pleurodeles waltl]